MCASKDTGSHMGPTQGGRAVDGRCSAFNSLGEGEGGGGGGRVELVYRKNERGGRREKGAKMMAKAGESRLMKRPNRKNLREMNAVVSRFLKSSDCSASAAE